MADKGDLTIPDTSSLTTFSNGEGNDVDADLINTNYSALLSQSIVVANVITDQMPQTEVPTSYSAVQDFQGGITTNTIQESTTNSDIVISTNGTGLAKYDSADASSEAEKEIANKGYVASVAFEAGNVPPGGTEGTWLEGNGTWTDPRWYLEESSPSSGFTAVNKGNYVLNAGDNIQLPTPSAGLRFQFQPEIGQDLTSSAITLLRNSTENIANDAANFTANLNAVYVVRSNGTDWDVSARAIGRVI